MSPTKLSKPRKRRKFTPEFKAEAVRLVERVGQAEEVEVSSQPATTGSSSLRGGADDVAGNAVDQTIIRAYALAP